MAGVAVVVPARNEERLVRAALDSITRAVSELHHRHPAIVVSVTLVADACTDGTAELASAAVGVTVLESEAGAVGSARAQGVRHALDRWGRQDRGSLWLAHTDADSTVPGDWLVEQVALADRGVDVMIGTVRPTPADLTPEQNAQWLATHQPGHPNGHVHGANLGLRASAYFAAGGFDPIEEHEDNALVARLRRGPWVIAASDACQVLTSGRFVGRTPGGYAGYLAETL
ncbi:hypothetical protein AX769_16040 [Frondihabitans sp. PAMC 28766]|nr:hypothetical protein AX769_16040 [Frondihabitans sp. PAMC 28766]